MMLVISLMVAFLSPLTTLVVKSGSVPGIQKFLYEFYDPIHQKAKNLKLICEASGTPKPRIEFHFHANDASYGKKLVNSSRVQVASDSAIIIKNVSAADTGTYRCYAINKNGRVFQNKKVRVKVAGSFNSGASLGDEAVTLDVELGREQEIICPVHTYPYPLQFSWGSEVKGKAPFYIRENDRIHITEKGDLYYSLIKREDVDEINNAGGISCMMNFHSEAIYSRKYKLHIEKDNASLTPPTLHVKLTGTTYILEGERDKTLTCIGGGNPVPHIKWFRNGEEITSNDSSFRISTSKPGKLIIKKFRRDLAGNYKCRLSNLLGNVHSDGNVILAERPVLVKPLKEGSTAAYLRRRLRLKCEAQGTLPIRYEWYKNGKALTSFTTQWQSMEIDEGYLTIDPVHNSTEGTYQCYAINSYGNTYSKTYVYVKEPSVITAGPVVGGPTTPPIKVVPGPSKIGQEQRDSLQLKYIIIIACSGAVFVVLVGGGIFMYCRSKDNSEEIIFVPTKETCNNNAAARNNERIKLELSRTDLKQALLQDLANLPPPPPSLTDHSDDDFSSYGGYKSNHPLYYNDHTMMYLMNHNKEEHLYADIPEDLMRCESATPSTEL